MHHDKSSVLAASAIDCFAMLAHPVTLIQMRAS
jgi:hypothetical protein